MEMKTWKSCSVTCLIKVPRWNNNQVTTWGLFFFCLSYFLLNLHQFFCINGWLWVIYIQVPFWRDFQVPHWWAKSTPQSCAWWRSHNEIPTTTLTCICVLIVFLRDEHPPLLSPRGIVFLGRQLLAICVCVIFWYNTLYCRVLSVFEHQSLDDEAFAHLSVSHKFRVAHISGPVV